MGLMRSLADTQRAADLIGHDFQYPEVGALSQSRIATLDAVRGVAVLGILLMNIVGFGMPDYAYIDPHYFGGATGANWWAWAIGFVLFDGKMRGLFTMLFGASAILIATRAVEGGESAARVHYARMFWLFVFGMVHAWLIWSGDILVLYAVAGSLAFLAWRLPNRVLILIAMSLMIFKLADGLTEHSQLTAIETAASVPGASPQSIHAWQVARDDIAPPPATAKIEIDGYRGNYADAFRVRAGTTQFMQSVILIISLPDTIALMLLGMALFRDGFFSGEWSQRRYRKIALGGFAICVPLYLPLIHWIDSTHFSPATLAATEAIHLTLLRPLLSLAWASLVILYVTSAPTHWLTTRLAAAGQMAFSNYLGTSALCTLFFNGYGLGWYGYLERWQLYGVVVAVWTVILLWSKPWLDHYHYGPMEWMWRSLARGHSQQMRRQIRPKP